MIGKKDKKVKKDNKDKKDKKDKVRAASPSPASRYGIRSQLDTEKLQREAPPGTSVVIRRKYRKHGLLSRLLCGKPKRSLISERPEYVRVDNSASGGRSPQALPQQAQPQGGYRPPPMQSTYASRYV
jgi:hypothetical protein